MEIVLGKTSGFCNGVNDAVENAERLLEVHKSVYCLGELVHNKNVMEKLQKNGLKIVQDINEIPSKAKVIIRTHGVSKRIYEIAKEKDIELYDYTCKKVLELHNLVNTYAKDNYYILILGDKSHSENIGTISFAGENCAILQEKEEIDNIIDSIRKSGTSKLLIIAQTTFCVDKFEEYIEKIQKKLDFNLHIEIMNTICGATRIRQEETKQIAKNSDLMIIIGGKNSSNTIKLYDIAIYWCNNAMHVETKEDLYMNYVKRFDKIGVMAGASTSQESIDEIMSILKRG